MGAGPLYRELRGEGVAFTTHPTSGAEVKEIIEL
jgi:hypothetical protein